MQVILLERIEKLGLMGDVVNVKPGYARNYLLPLKKAMRATKDNIAVFEKQRAHLEAQNLKHREDAQAVAKRMEGLTVVLLRQAGESGQLYGSVANRDVAQAITTAGFTVERRQVLLAAERRVGAGVVVCIHHGRSYGTPDARRFGPVMPMRIANSGLRTPMPFVRCSQIGLAAISSSYWSTWSRMNAISSRALRSKPRGRSSATPPTWQ